MICVRFYMFLLLETYYFCGRYDFRKKEILN